MANLVKYPFPLGHGEFCFLYLPNPLAPEVAARIIATIRTIVIKPSEESTKWEPEPDGQGDR